MKEQQKGNIMLLLAAVIWGAAFVAQSEGMNYVGPYTMQATRFFLAGLVLIPVIWLRDKKGRTENRPVTSADKKKVLKTGMICGVILFVASTLQQVGLLYTTVGKSGFITALYVVLVPLLGMLFGDRSSGRVWLGVGLAVVGLYYLCIREELAIGFGDLLTLLCALVFSVQILFVDRFGGSVDGVRFSMISFFTCSALAAIFMFAVEQPTISAILRGWLSICYAGILSGGVGYTLQNLGQRRTKPVIASLLMSLESVFAALFGWLLLAQTLSGRELLGCGLMFAAILLAQLPGKRKN